MASGEPIVPAVEMVREKMWVERPAGTHLSEARTGGGHSPLVRDNETNELLTHAKLIPVADDEDQDQDQADFPSVFLWDDDDDASDSEEPSPLEALVGLLILVGASYAVANLAPHATRWWNDQAFPALRSAWHRLPGTGRADSPAVTDESATVIESASATPSHDVVVALDEYRAAMSAAEARERLFIALAARLISDEQLRVLRGARIEDEDDSPELERAVAALTPEQVGAGITLMLETHPSLAHGQPLADLQKVLASGRGDDGYVLTRDARIKEALPLTAGEA
jgi:hypothetical protein